ncbi:MAG: dephospho-CoA kinase [Dehalococcoidia bacterium]|nr:dephospho-CoA kinase [Dehalococcoidia bacterium]
MVVIGLTGGIGTGKSTVSAMLADHGSVIINADLVGHEAYLPHQNVWDTVVAAFGRDILTDDDQVDRRKLGAVVFQDPAALQRLNAIVHPWIFQRIAQLLNELRSKGTRVAVVEAALLIEAGWRSLADQVWVTVAGEEQVVQRLQTRNGLTPQQVRDRMRTQLSTEERMRYADVIIDTSGALEDVRASVRSLWESQVAAALKGAP